MNSDSLISRRDALKTMALTSGMLVLPKMSSEGQQPVGEVHKLPPLGYDYDALEPHIDAETMKLHHDKHHAAYVAKLNQALEKEPSLATRSVEDLLKSLDSIPETVRADIRNQGGGHYNHTLFWQTLQKKENAAPEGELARAIVAGFGTQAALEEQLQAAAMKQFGSGWAWLVLRAGKLGVEATANQDSPLSSGGYPLLGLDVWEHAYYLKYQNRRAEYVKAIFHVLNWEFVGERFRQATA
jgi:Fe-Mn family superoxide dismutase